jgi:transposase
MYRFDLTDAQWERIAPCFPDRYHHSEVGHPWNDNRPLVKGILGHLHTGTPWPDTPGRYPMVGVTPDTACRTRTYGKCQFEVQPPVSLRFRSCSDNMKAISPYGTNT